MDDSPPSLSQEDRGSNVGPLAVVLLVVLIVFLPSTAHPFVDCDDSVHVVANQRLLPPSIDGVLWFWKNPYRGLYIPLAYTFFAVETEFAMVDEARDGLPKVDPFVFHVGSLILHAICAGLIYLLLVELVQNRWAATVGALLFALHPLQVENVAWVSMTPGLLAAALSLFALWQYVVYCQQEQHGGPPSPWNRRFRFAIATVALAAALLCKPTAAATPLLATCLRFGWLERPIRSGWIGMGLWFGLAVLSAVIAKSIQTDSQIIGLTSARLRPLVATDAIAFYVYKLLLPFGLTLDYSRTPARAAEQGWLYYTWVLPVGIAVALWWSNAGRKWWTACALFVAGLAPVLGLVPFGYQQTSTVADRYVYLAMLGPALALAWWLTINAGRYARRIAVGGVALLALLSFQQNRIWQGSEPLAEHGIRINPESYLLHLVRADSRNRQGQTSLALQDFIKAQRLAPQLPEVHVHVGDALRNHHKPILASEAFQRALDIEPRHLGARNGLGLAYLEQDRYERAITTFREALEIREDSAGVHNNLGDALRLAGDREAALAEYRRAIELNPRLVAAQNNLGLELVATGDLDAAIEHFQQALGQLPNSADLHNSLGAIYFKQAAWTQAAEQFALALELRPEFPEAATNLAAAQEHLAP